MKVQTKTQRQRKEYHLIVNKLNSFSGEKLHLEKTRDEKLSHGQKLRLNFLTRKINNISRQLHC